MAKDDRIVQELSEIKGVLIEIQNNLKSLYNRSNLHNEDILDNLRAIARETRNIRRTRIKMIYRDYLIAFRYLTAKQGVFLGFALIHKFANTNP